MLYREWENLEEFKAQIGSVDCACIEFLDYGGIDIAAYCNLMGYRCAIVLCCTDTFNSANTRFANILFAYRGGNFNIKPPLLQPHAVSVFDRIGHLPAGEPDNDAIATWHINEFPNGFSAVDMANYCGMEDIRHCKIRRLTWQVGCIIKPEFAYIHPNGYRFITDDEFALLVYDELEQWANRQIAAFGSWGEQDIEGHYSDDDARWKMRDANGAEVKYFNMVLYRPRHYRQGI